MVKHAIYERRRKWARALEQIALMFGKNAPIYEILGTVAWGRYEGEPNTTDTKDNALLGLGFLQGVRYAALNAARLYKLQGERDLANIHERLGRER